jgi:hypothetical protein
MEDMGFIITGTIVTGIIITTIAADNPGLQDTGASYRRDGAVAIARLGSLKA